jgi:hypothetical protein
VDEADEVLGVTEEGDDAEEATELDEADDATALDGGASLDEEGATLDEDIEVEEEATLDEDNEIMLARPDATDVGRDTTLEAEEGDTTAGQLLGFVLMLSATLVRLKYASILRIFNTLSARGGPCAQLLPLLLRVKGTISMFFV